VWQWVSTYTPRIIDRICDTSLLLDDAAEAGKKIIFEAQLGALRDVYYGIYPYTSSSCVLASFAPIGSGLFGRPLDCVVVVMKAVATCVGAGPFVTAMSPAEADELREVAYEYGAATGRPRRIGHFDAIASRYGVHIQGTTEIALTKLDSLSGRDRLLVCTAYRIDGRTTADFPVAPALELAEPVYDELPGWREDISGVREFAHLPANARHYVLTIERLVGCPIRYISVGPDREAMIDRGAEREASGVLPTSRAV
jgi:adenylosuccinate synthase